MSGRPPRWQSFLSELKRRRVFRVAAVYAAGAFAIMQVADLMFPRLGLPEWTVTLVVWLAIFGFLLTLVLAWAFDFMPDGVRRTEAAPAEVAAGARPVPPWLSLRSALAVLGLVTAGLVAGWFLRPAATGAFGGATSDARPSLAVLPFENLSDDQANEYFSDGLAEELRNALTRVPGLKVAARTSSFSFKGKDVDIPTIAAALGVRNVVEGSVRKAGDRVRITVQLINAEDGFHLWSETYDRRLEDIIAVQEEIARSITKTLEVRLADNGERHLVRARPSRPEAYEAYLRGRFFWNKRTTESIQAAIREFRSALDLDPTFALAWAGLADAYLTLQWYLVDADWAVLLEQGRAAAEKALEIDPDLAQAHIALGLYHASRFRWDAADEQFRRGLALDPSYPTAHQWYALTLAPLGRLEEAIEHARIAAELDPLSPVINRGYGMILMWAGRFEEALAVLDRTVALDTTYQGIWDTYTQLHALLGRWDDAAAAPEWRMRLRGVDPALARHVMQAAEAYARTGNSVAIPSGFDRLAELPTTRARLLSMMGAGDVAIVVLEDALASGNPYVREISVDPWLRSLHGDARFLALLAKMDLRPVEARR